MRVALDKDFRLCGEISSIFPLASKAADSAELYTVNWMELYWGSFTFSDIA